MNVDPAHLLTSASCQVIISGRAFPVPFSVPIWKILLPAFQLNKLKTCEFHFKECRNRQARKLNKHDRRNFKDLCNGLLEAVSPTAYEKSKEDLENFVAESEERKYLQSWIEWWHKRRNYIFRAFVQFDSAPKLNHAELIHASWVKRDRMNMPLLDAAYADSRDKMVQGRVEQPISSRKTK